MIDRELRVKIQRARPSSLAKWWTAINRRRWPKEMRRWESDETNEAMAVMDVIAAELGLRWIVGKLSNPPQRIED